MNAQLMDLVAPLIPEIVLGTGICLVLLAGAFAGKHESNVSYLLAMLSLLATAWVTGSEIVPAEADIPGGAFLVDGAARLLKVFALAAVAVVFVYSRAILHHRRQEAGNFYLLALFATLGIMVMISAGSFLVMYLGLEILSLALYAMVAGERDAPAGAEAAIKYFVLGAIASGCLLYGISIIYGVVGTIVFTDVAAVLMSKGDAQMALLVALVFIMVGIAFKFGAVPFHMWLPDVYQGAPPSVTLFVATVPKVAAFALALRVLTDALGPIAADWQLIVAVIAVLSLGLGNIVAIAQTNLRRMLGYSTVAHVGFILFGFIARDNGGIEAALFYTLIYVIMAAGAFGMVIYLGFDSVNADELDNLKGLSRRSPWFAGIMLLVMVSMIGVPPFAGFYAKWWVLSALLDAGHVWLALIGVFFSVVGAFYYLRVIWLMYFEDGRYTAPASVTMDFRLLLSANGILVLVIGLFPGRLLDLCAQVL
jgi:NADH-quinone oxidoreductase subunit N